MDLNAPMERAVPSQGSNHGAIQRQIRDFQDSVSTTTALLEDEQLVRSDTLEVIASIEALRAIVDSKSNAQSHTTTVALHTSINSLLQECISRAKDHVVWSDARIETRERDRDREIQRMKRERMQICAQLPIYRLPDEVLVLIFMHYMEDAGPFDPLKLAQVSSLWRAVVTHTSRLWTRVELDVGLSSILKLKEAARAQPASPGGFVHEFSDNPFFALRRAAPGFHAPRGLYRISDAKEWLARAGDVVPLDIFVHWDAPETLNSIPKDDPGLEDSANSIMNWIELISSLRPRWRTLEFLYDAERQNGPHLSLSAARERHQQIQETVCALRAIFIQPAPRLVKLVAPPSGSQWQRELSFYEVLNNFSHGILGLHVSASKRDKSPLLLEAPQLEELVLHQRSSLLNIKQLARLTSLSLPAAQLSAALRELHSNVYTSLQSLSITGGSGNIPLIDGENPVTLHALQELFVENANFLSDPRGLTLPALALLHTPNLLRLRLCAPNALRLRDLVAIRPALIIAVEEFLKHSNPPLEALHIANIALDDAAILKILLFWGAGLRTLVVRNVKIPETLGELAKRPGRGAGGWLCPLLRDLTLEKAGKKTLMTALRRNRGPGTRDASREFLRSMLWDGHEEIR